MSWLRWGLAAGIVLVAAIGVFLLVRPAPEPRIEPELKRQIGQMLMVGFRGTDIDQSWPQTLRDQIADGTVGGVLFLGRNVADLDRIAEMSRAFAAAAGAEAPPLIAVDQEGGRIQRLRAGIGFPEVPSAASLGRDADPQLAGEYYRMMAGELARLGFNVNFGPVVDLDIEPQNPIISMLERAYSPDPEIVTTFARAFLLAHREAGLIAAPKHFPGHGSTLVDSHEQLPDISQSWTEVELEPYRRLIVEELADMIMIGHLALSGNDGQPGPPATLSSEIVTDLLRGELGFEGVIVSDDLDMRAITAIYEPEEAAIAAIGAGIDLLIVSNFERSDPLLPNRLVRAIALEAMRDEELRHRIAESSDRIERLKAERLAAPPAPS